MAAHTQDERSFDERYRLWARRSGELFDRGQPVHPRRRGQQRPDRQVRLEALSAVHGRGHRVAAARRRRPRVRRLPARPGPDDPRPPAPGGHPGRGRRHHRPRHLLRPALRAGDRGGRARSSRPCPASTWSGSPTPAARWSAPPSGWPARYTGRRLIIRFEGHYHGWQDTVYWSNHVDPELAGPASMPRPVPSGPGVPAELADTLIVLTWNDPESFVAVMAERGDEVAAVITEPAVFNTGCILPEPGYLELLRERDPAARRAADLRRGDHRLPVRAGRRAGVLRRDPGPDHAWPRAWAAASPSPRSAGQHEAHVDDRRGPLLALRHLQRQHRSRAPRSARPWTCWPSPACTSGSARSGESLMSGLRKLAADAGLPVIVEGLGTVFQIWFSEQPDPQLAGRRALRRRGAVHPVVAGDAAARRACSTPASTRTCSCRSCTPARTSPSC